MPSFCGIHEQLARVDFKAIGFPLHSTKSKAQFRSIFTLVNKLFKNPSASIEA
jgi:hypothetical protein